MTLGKKIAAGTGLVAIAALAVAAVYRQAVFLLVLGFILKPSVVFDPAKAPPSPDYSNAASWAALPETDDASDWLPPGYSEPANPLKDQVDVFYIHPTGFFGTKNWNAAMGEEIKLGIPTGAMLGSQASAFNGVGKVYAPEYRQATLYSFLERERDPSATNGRQALELAYSDVAKAFDYFLEHYNKGRPFILASHSQGSCHALRLIAEKIDGTEVHKRMIAAYLVGFGMPRDYFDRVYKNVKPGLTPTQTDCVVTWDTLREGVVPQVGGLHYYPGGWENAKGKPRFCVNPLTWTAEGGRAPGSLNLGALETNLGGIPMPKISPSMLKGVVPGMTWAEIRDNGLHVRDLAGTSYVTLMSTGGNYHLFDYNLFWVNIRQNALAREQAYLQAHPA